MDFAAEIVPTNKTMARIKDIVLFFEFICFLSGLNLNYFPGFQAFLSECKHT